MSSAGLEVGMSGPVVVVLAAGSGSRFGGLQHKLAQDFGGSTVLGSTLRQVLASHLPMVVVATAATAEIACRSVAARDVVVLPEVGSETGQHLGMGYSIASGVSARPEASAWLVLPGDMPLVTPATLRSVARELGQHAVVFAQHRGRRGHPVGFSAELFSELVLLRGDEGARRLLARYPAHGVELDDPGVLADIDTAADLEKLRAISARPASPAAPAVTD
jgi:molybdenum cofactor cytidylyltransferase